MEQFRKTINELLVELFTRILAIEENSLKEAGAKLSMTEIHTLEQIEKSTTKTMSDVAKALSVTQGTLTVNINRLHKKGYVNRVKDTKDRRISRLMMTEKADEALRLHTEFHDRMIDSLISNLSVEQDKEIITSLQKVLDYFKQQD